MEVGGVVDFQYVTVERFLSSASLKVDRSALLNNVTNTTGNMYP